MSRLFVGLYTAPDGQLLADITPRLRSLEWSANEHGDAELTATLNVPLGEQMSYYDPPRMLHVAVFYAGIPVWEGRLEDVYVRYPAPMQLRAFGYQRALSDLPYTALWSNEDITPWRPVVSTELNFCDPNLYLFDKYNRLRIGLTKNTVYLNNSAAGAWALLIPSLSSRSIVYVAYNYYYNLPSGWVYRLCAYNSSWGAQLVNNITTSGGTSGGSSSWTFGGRSIITLETFNASGSNYTNTADTGVYHAQVSSMRVMSVEPPCSAEKIAADIVTHVVSTNSAQLRNTTAFIESPGLDLYNEVYEDALPTNILNRLARLGDNQTPPRQWEWGVQDRALYFRPKGSAGRTWYVDVSTLDIQRSLSEMYNSAYAVYQAVGGQTLRTGSVSDTLSVERWGLTRHLAVPTRTTRATQAAVHRDAALADRKDPAPRGVVETDRVYDAAGNAWPVFFVRPGDTIIRRNLPPNLGELVDRIRSFRVSEMRYDAFANRGVIVPELPAQSLDVLIARQEAGIG